ncbi:hypothetical protein [Pseudovibrio sp. Ad37]|uniref:hypothetical protein n=1 Tax=Pseudovibrio sp. Ad37 TaxID=989422 RepID=UPI00187D39B0|nr:hypothetical protein [Pseudovibrio sp. Ad37]
MGLITVATFLGDGAYDGTPVRQELADRFEGIEVKLGLAVLNTMTAFGRATFEKVSA